MKQLAPQMTLNQTQHFGQDANTPLHLPSGWWLVPLLGLGVAMSYWIISAIRSAMG